MVLGESLGCEVGCEVGCDVLEAGFGEAGKAGVLEADDGMEDH